MRPDVVFGADLIAGFPTETDEMFENTLDIVARCGLTYLHVFPFSPRKGTPAARMPQVAHATIKDRAARLREAGSRVYERFLDGQQGERIELLMEREDTGRTPQYAEVRVDRKAPIGTFQWATLGHNDGRRLNGMVAA